MPQANIANINESPNPAKIPSEYAAKPILIVDSEIPDSPLSDGLESPGQSSRLSPMSSPRGLRHVKFDLNKKRNDSIKGQSSASTKPQNMQRNGSNLDSSARGMRESETRPVLGLRPSDFAILSKQGQDAFKRPARQSAKVRVTTGPVDLPSPVGLPSPGPVVGLHLRQIESAGPVVDDEFCVNRASG